MTMSNPVKGPFDLLVIGEGPVGLMAAKAAQARGMSCLMLEKQPPTQPLLRSPGGYLACTSEGRYEARNVLLTGDGSPHL
jgi:thioredoxin reductase